MPLKKLTDDFIKKVIEITAGKLSPEVLETYFKLLTNEIKKYYFTKSAESNLLRIIKSQYDVSFFIAEGIKYPHHAEILVSVSANSNYLSDVLVINPEYFYWVINPSVLKTELNENTFADDISEKLKHYKTFDAKVNALKNLKRKEILHIGLKDILNLGKLSTVVKELSILANVLTAELFSACFEFVLNKHQVTKVKNEYCIVALGKLGGMELNYSSDIDLIIFYDEDAKIKNKYYSEILTEAIQLMVQKASVGSTGFLYRIDLRLRPDGKFSPICRSISEYLNYYESRGEDWERQMLIKANFLGGSKNLFKKFVDYLTPFIYPASFSTSPMEQIKRIKDNIEKNIYENENIKLSVGGIRDIEFPVQALQLLNGGKHVQLRTGNTLNAIKQLKDLALLKKREAEQFENAYTLYRKIEHFLQLMNDRQTHVIPSDKELAEQLSSFSGYNNSNEFKAKLEKHKNAVRKIYDSIISDGKKEQSDENDFSSIKFTDYNRTKSNISFLSEGKGLVREKSFDRKSIRLFQKIEKSLYTYLKCSVQPDKTLDNFVRVIKFAEFPSIWYNEFTDEKNFNSFLQLCECSQKSIDLFAEDKSLRDLFLAKKLFDEIEESKLKDLQPREILFILSAQVCLKIISPIDASKILSKFVLQKIILLCDQYSETKKWKENYFTAAMGSTGSAEMSFASDIDLIFVVNKITRYQNVQNHFQELLAQIKNSLAPFPVDCRLRPEGKSSQLVWDLDSYKKYYEQRARIWELQSLMKIKFTAGDKNIFTKLLNTTQNRIKSEDKNNISDAIKEMKKKFTSTFSVDTNIMDLKKNPGGLTDIEFAVHFLMLTEVIKIKFENINSTPALIDFLIVNKIYPQDELKKLKVNYKLIKNLEIANQIISNTSSSKFFASEENYKLAARLLNINDHKLLSKKLMTALKENLTIYNKILG